MKFKLFNAKLVTRWNANIKRRERSLQLGFDSDTYKKFCIYLGSRNMNLNLQVALPFFNINNDDKIIDVKSVDSDVNEKNKYFNPYIITLIFNEYEMNVSRLFYMIKNTKKIGNKDNENGLVLTTKMINNCDYRQISEETLDEMKHKIIMYIIYHSSEMLTDYNLTTICGNRVYKFNSRDLPYSLYIINGTLKIESKYLNYFKLHFVDINPCDKHITVYAHTSNNCVYISAIFFTIYKNNRTCLINKCKNNIMDAISVSKLNLNDTRIDVLLNFTKNEYRLYFSDRKILKELKAILKKKYYITDIGDIVQIRDISYYALSPYFVIEIRVSNEYKYEIAKLIEYLVEEISTEEKIFRYNREGLYKRLDLGDLSSITLFLSQNPSILNFIETKVNLISHSIYKIKIIDIDMKNNALNYMMTQQRPDKYLYNSYKLSHNSQDYSFSNFIKYCDDLTKCINNNKNMKTEKIDDKYDVYYNIIKNIYLKYNKAICENNKIIISVSTVASYYISDPYISKIIFENGSNTICNLFSSYDIIMKVLEYLNKNDGIIGIFVNNRYILMYEGKQKED